MCKTPVANLSLCISKDEEPKSRCLSHCRNRLRTGIVLEGDVGHGLVDDEIRTFNARRELSVEERAIPLSGRSTADDRSDRVGRVA